MKADLHPLLEIPTIKVRNEFDNTSVELGPAQGKIVNLGVGYLGFCSPTNLAACLELFSSMICASESLLLKEGTG